MGLALAVMLVSGCSAVHRRQALYPNGREGVVGVRKEPSRAGQARAPHIDLRVEPETTSTPPTDPK